MFCPRTHNTRQDAQTKNAKVILSSTKSMTFAIGNLMAGYGIRPCDPLSVGGAFYMRPQTSGSLPGAAEPPPPAHLLAKPQLFDLFTSNSPSTFSS